ncbi:integrase catalytic domain-containing protein [Nephila pilipes]|uniref:Integrase catalytic domain-containing protein n=1 Tax=Nephila pilipes TaxID=299642 RepID=A0A8X6NE70_NEPPI|nr:integrase catalytic domain-containing protein [Nephila pilipes]
MEGIRYSYRRSQVLDLAWDPDAINLSFDIQELSKFVKKRCASKIFILGVVGHIFNPVGLLDPFVTKEKYFLQELGSHNLDWNERLPSSLDHKWHLRYSEVEHLGNIRINRYCE